MAVSDQAMPVSSPTARGRGRPPGRKPLADREQIIAAAVQAIRASGPKVTMDDIAAAANVTKPIIYRTVGDKQAVAEAVAEQLSIDVELMTLQHLNTHSDRETTFKAAARAFFELLADERALFQFVDYGWGSDDGKQMERMIERSALPLIEAYDKSRLSDAYPASAGRTWAYATVGAMRTVAVMWVRDEYCSIDELVAYMSDYVQRSLSRSASKGGTPLSDPESVSRRP